jgi:sec-independent protein translocase protein TatA
VLTAFEPWHLIVIGGIAVVLFGAKRLPDSARSIGQSLRIFRSEVDAARTTPGETAAQTTTRLPAPAPEPHR